MGVKAIQMANAKVRSGNGTNRSAKFPSISDDGEIDESENDKEMRDRNAISPLLAFYSAGFLIRRNS